MKNNNLLIPFINLGHALDHLVMLIFPTVVLALSRDLNRPYAELLPLSLGGFIAFGVLGLPAGWLGDRWSRYKMMTVFFFGLGGALVLTGFATETWQIAAGLTVLGMFAAIYHPVATAMIVADPKVMGKVLGWNGLYGNLGLAFAAVVSGFLMDYYGWRTAFFVPGAICMAAGIGWLLYVADPGAIVKTGKKGALHVDNRTMVRIILVLLVVTSCGGLIFNSTTISMPKVFDERLSALTSTSLGIGLLVSMVYTIAAFSQVVIGPMIDKHDLRTLLWPLSLAQVVLLFAASQLDGWPMLAVAVLMMLAVFGQIPLNDAIVGRYTPDEYRSRVFAVRYLVTFGVASMAVPMISHYHKTSGFRSVFLVLAAMAACTLVASFFFPSRAALKQQSAASAQPAQA
ncbi:MAG: MFS transporter [Burkholderiales bacterium]